MTKTIAKTLLIAVAILLSLSPFPAAAQAAAGQHTVTLTWADTVNPATGTAYTVYRATGLCSGTPTFSKLATAVTLKTFTDATVTPGNYCYQVTATFSAVESSPSNSAAAAVPTFAPTALVITVQ